MTRLRLASLHRAQLRRLRLAAMLACGLGAVAAASAAPNISRLSPPSNPPLAGASTLARFLPGQKFDLQATVQPDAGSTISSVRFAVDGKPLVTLSNDGSAADQFSGASSLVKNGLVKDVAAGSVVASLRGHAQSRPGLHTLTVTAVDSTGAQTTRSGQFEVMALSTGTGRPAKNIIFLLGDGMGASHRTAARIMSRGYLQGVAQGRLAMDSFPVTGMVMTASLNSIVTDSAPGMSNYVNGNKGANNMEGVFPDDTVAAFDNPRIEYLSEYLHRRKGTALGIVTTADVFDATPAANAVHTASRGQGTGIVDQFLDDRQLTGLKVLMGGGRKWFLPNPSDSTKPQAANGSQRRHASDYVLPPDVVAGWAAAPGKLDADRDLINDFQAAGFAYASDRSTLAKLVSKEQAADKLLGLFSHSNMNVAFDKINGRRGTSTVVADYGFPDQPMLDEMADAALAVMAKGNDKGFLLLIEGASIDKQSHLMDTDRWLLETLEFDRAVARAKAFAEKNPDTLVIVTADHECSGAAIIGASMISDTALRALPATTADKRNKVVGVYESAGFPAYAMQADGYPATTDIDRKMLIGYGANADRYEAWVSNAQPTRDEQQPFAEMAPLSSYPASVRQRNESQGFLVTGQVASSQAVHTGTDVPLSAFGRGALLFTGVFDNTDVFFKMGQLMLGGLPKPVR
jgi:alkaline phosphatase